MCPSDMANQTFRHPSAASRPLPLRQEAYIFRINNSVRARRTIYADPNSRVHNYARCPFGIVRRHACPSAEYKKGLRLRSNCLGSLGWDRFGFSDKIKNERKKLDIFPIYDSKPLAPCELAANPRYQQKIKEARGILDKLDQLSPRADA